MTSHFISHSKSNCCLHKLINAGFQKGKNKPKPLCSISRSQPGYWEPALPTAPHNLCSQGHQSSELPIRSVQHHPLQLGFSVPGPKAANSGETTRRGQLSCIHKLCPKTCSLLLHTSSQLCHRSRIHNLPGCLHPSPYHALICCSTHHLRPYPSLSQVLIITSPGSAAHFSTSVTEEGSALLQEQITTLSITATSQAIQTHVLGKFLQMSQNYTAGKKVT